MVDKLRLHRTSTQYTNPLAQPAPVDHEGNVSAIQSDLSVVAATQQDIVRLCRSWIFLLLMLTKHRFRNGKLKTTSRKLIVKRKHSIYGTWCTNTPPKKRRGHAQDATLLASSGSIPTNVAPKPHVTPRVWCVRKCATKESNEKESEERREAGERREEQQMTGD